MDTPLQSLSQMLLLILYLLQFLNPLYPPLQYGNFCILPEPNPPDFLYFSFCNTVGPSTTSKGYQKADIFDKDGNKKKGLGRR